MLSSQTRHAVQKVLSRANRTTLLPFSAAHTSLLTQQDGAASTPGLQSFRYLAPVRPFHSSVTQQSATVLAVGVGVGAIALAAKYALQASAAASAAANPTEGAEGSSDNAKAASAEEATESKANMKQEEKTSASSSSSSAENVKKAEEKKKEEAAKSSTAAGSSSLFGAQSMARRFYKGGFEDKMTRREAALILGVRESSEPTRIRDRHRKLLMANHPDTGGSTYIASKVNEAKELLIKGRTNSSN